MKTTIKVAAILAVAFAAGESRAALTNYFKANNNEVLSNSTSWVGNSGYWPRSWDSVTFDSTLSAENSILERGNVGYTVGWYIQNVQGGLLTLTNSTFRDVTPMSWLTITNGTDLIIQNGGMSSAQGANGTYRIGAGRKLVLTDGNFSSYNGLRIFNDGTILVTNLAYSVRIGGRSVGGFGPYSHTNWISGAGTFKAANLYVGENAEQDAIPRAIGLFVTNQTVDVMLNMIVGYSNRNVNIHLHGASLYVSNGMAHNSWGQGLEMGKQGQSTANMTLTGGSVVTAGTFRVGSTWLQGTPLPTSASLTINNGDVRVDRMMLANGHMSTGTVNLVNGTLSARQYAASGWGTAVGTTTLGAGGTMTVGEFSSSSADGGRLIFDGGTLKPMFDAPFWLGGATNSAGALTLAFNTTISDNGAVIDTDGFDVTVRNILENATGETGKLTKLGQGTLTLMGAGAYTGNTTVEAGTLRVEANMNSGLITVKNAAELSVADSVSVKDIALEDGSSLVIGNSVGFISADNLTLYGTTTWQVDLEGMSGSDQLVLSGNLTANLYGFDFEEFILDFMGGGENGGSYTLIQFSGIDPNLQASDFKVQNLAAGLDGAIQIDTMYNEITLTVIPEPASLGAIGILALGVLLRRKLRR